MHVVVLCVLETVLSVEMVRSHEKHEQKRESGVGIIFSCRLPYYYHTYPNPDCLAVNTVT